MRPKFSSARCCCGLSPPPPLPQIASIAYGKSEGTGVVDAVFLPGPNGDFITYYRLANIAVFDDHWDSVWLYDWDSGVDRRFLFEPPDNLKREYVVLLPRANTNPGASSVTIDIRVVLETARSVVPPGFTYEVYGLKRLLTTADTDGFFGFDINFTAAEFTTAKHVEAFAEVPEPGGAFQTIDVTDIVNEVTGQPGYDRLIHYVTFIVRPTGTFFPSPYDDAAKAIIEMGPIVYTP